MKNVPPKTPWEEHSHCVLCGRNNRRGLKLNFQLTDNGSVDGSVKCSKSMQGYKNMVHGGVISALLDSAMTNCLFAHGIRALTAELKVRFLRPVKTTTSIFLRAFIKQSYGDFHLLKAELRQNNLVKARAEGKFFAVAKIGL